MESNNDQDIQLKGLSLMLYKLKFFFFRNFAMILGDE